jgi:hypothetical protein
MGIWLISNVISNGYPLFVDSLVRYMSGTNLLDFLIEHNFHSEVTSRLLDVFVSLRGSGCFGLICSGDSGRSARVIRAPAVSLVTGSESLYRGSGWADGECCR